jgi:hypothetical protein
MRAAHKRTEEEVAYMKKALFRVLIINICALLLLPALLTAQQGQTTAANPPIAQPLVREGDFAVKLVEALGLGTAANETEAETMLGIVGIAPRNGWIADYPVTPDILGELQNSVSDAADSQRLSMGKDEALNELQAANDEFKMPVMPYTAGQTDENPESSETYPTPTVVNNYYANQGPPVVTYYAPPLNYYYLYTWVPYPFWWSNFWFRGYYCLVDFHKVITIGTRVEVISNHFVDPRTNAVFRIDPVKRLHGRTYAGIGIPRGRKGLVSPKVSGGAPKIFSGSRDRAISGSRANPSKTSAAPSGEGK